MIIDGYKGVMPLDLTNVDIKYHKIMIQQHKADIKEYKKYQRSLEPRLRYDNSTKIALEKAEKDLYFRSIRIKNMQS